MKIEIYPATVLRKKCAAIEGIGSKEKKLFLEMTELMRAAGGIGLAAPQVGILKDVIVANSGEKLLKMGNPKILSENGSAFLEEGCLSVPGKNVDIERAMEISVSYIDENDKKRTETFRDLTARVIQHEIDHLNGRLIIDYLPWYKRLFL